MTEFIATSVARRLIARMQATHERRRISVFSGPPGIGKTTAIDEFAKRNRREVVVVKVARRNAREILVLQHTLEALRRLIGSPLVHAPSSVWELRNDLFKVLCTWADIDVLSARHGEYDLARLPRMTVIFDEAQNLSREVIDTLRYWNDADRCYAPFPLALGFVGNNEFSLAGASASDSVISAAVADRALYLQTLDYEDIADDDLALIIDAHGDYESGAVAGIIRAFRGPRSQRSLRRLSDLLDELEYAAGQGPITAAVVHQHLVLT